MNGGDMWVYLSSNMTFLVGVMKTSNARTWAT